MSTQDAHRNIILPDEAHNIMRDEYFAHRAIDALMTGHTWLFSYIVGESYLIWHDVRHESDTC